MFLDLFFWGPSVCGMFQKTFAPYKVAGDKRRLDAVRAQQVDDLPSLGPGRERRETRCAPASGKMASSMEGLVRGNIHGLHA